jgi:hypothetical protein
MNALRLKIRNVVPPRGWRFACPALNYRSRTENNSLKQCLREMTQFYRDNDQPMPDDPVRYIEQAMCEELGPEWCEGFDPSVVKSTAPVITVADFEQGMVTMGHNLGRSIAEGRRITVEFDEVVRRAHICATSGGTKFPCRFNTPISGCSGCVGSVGKIMAKAAGAVANLIVGCPETPDDKFLNSCAICKCNLKAKICVPLDIIRQHMTEEQKVKLPDFCWIK